MKNLTLEQACNVARRLALDEHDLRVQPVGGGDTCPTSLVLSGTATVFVKCAPPERSGLLSSEADGLRALAKTGCVRVPRILGLGQFEAEDGTWLALEALDLQARSVRADEILGRQLAALHRHTGDQHGWHRNNYLGLSVQSNQPMQDWAAFFRDQRLAPHIERLLQQHPKRDLDLAAERLLNRWSALSAGHQPSPSLLHGDLWSGNAAALGNDTPVIFDPAVHYGDRECDLAMVALFGGFQPVFFQAYEQIWPLPSGWQERRAFYQLYHLLNHANLFGGAYLDRVEHELQQLGGRG